MIIRNKTGKHCILICLLLCTLCFIQTGCTRTTEDRSVTEDYTIGVVTKSAGSEYWMSVASGMETAAEECGVSVLIVSPDTENNVKMQEQMIDDMIQKGVDVLAVSPLRSKAADYLETARQKGVSVVAYDTRILTGDVTYVGIDNYKAGENLAAEMQRQLNDTGTVGIITGNLEQEAHARRLEGMRDYIEKNTNMKITFVESGYSNLMMSQREIAQLCAKYPDVKGIFATSAVTAMGIKDYLRDSDVKIMTIDAQQDAIREVEDGGFAALAAQSGYDIGYETIRYIAEHKGQDMDTVDDKILDAEIVTKDNVELWKE